MFKMERCEGEEKSIKAKLILCMYLHIKLIA